MLIPEFFRNSELSCKCGCGTMPPQSSIYRLYALRLLWGGPLVVNSAARCKAHNAAVKGKAGSTHMPDKDRAGSVRGGGAFDISTRGIDQRKLEAVAVRCGFTGIGEAKTFLHLDDANRASITKWIYT